MKFLNYKSVFILIREIEKERERETETYAFKTERNNYNK